MQTPVALLSLVACFSLAGCCARCPQASPATLSPAVSGCVLGPPDAHVQLGEGGTVASALTSERYQRPGCAARFVVEVAAALGRSFAVVAGWGEPLPDEERTCGEAVADVEVYGHALRFERGSGGSRSGGSYRFVWKRLGSALLVGAYLMGRCRLVAVRGGRVEAVWPVDARGKIR